MYTKQYLTKWSDLTAVLEAAANETKVGFDLELENLTSKSKLAGFSLYLPSTKAAYYVPINHVGQETWDQELRPAIGNLVSKLKVVTYNGSFDIGRWYYWFGVRPQIIGDANILAKMFQTHEFGLKTMSAKRGITSSPITIEDILGTDKFDFTQAPLNERTLDYVTQDAYLAVALEEVVRTEKVDLVKFPAFESVYKIELDVMPILGRAGLRGIAIDRDAFDEAVKLMVREAEDLSDDILRILGRDDVSLEDFKINSGPRLAAALLNPPDKVVPPLPAMKPRQRKPPKRDDRDLPGLGLTYPGKATEGGQPSMAIIELERMTDQHEVIDMVIRWKSLNSILTKDVKHVAEWAGDGRVYPQFVQLGEDSTSRIYTGQPNVISMSKSVRAAMPPDPGKVYIHIDFQAAEWRIAALLAGQDDVLEVLDKGQDPHKVTFSKMSGKPIEEVTKEDRKVGKVLNYAALFGSTGYSIARALKSDEAYANEQSKKFWEAYTKLNEWKQARFDYAKKHSRTYTVLGRIRELRIFGASPQEKARACRRSVNTATQGSCGDALKLALIQLDAAAENPESVLNKLHARIVCPVFDAVLVEIDTTALESKEVVETALREVIEVVLSYEGRSTKMRCDIGWSDRSWLAAMGK